MTGHDVASNPRASSWSLNWPPSAARTNDEPLLVIHSPQLAAHFNQEMNRLWDTAELGIDPQAPQAGTPSDQMRK